jgi:hypothetical protein
LKTKEDVFNCVEKVCGCIQPTYLALVDNSQSTTENAVVYVPVDNNNEAPALPLVELYEEATIEESND